MKILAIDCCSSSCSAAVIDESKLLSLSLLDCGLGHSKTILVQIDQVLKNTGLTLRDMDYIATTVGPGSFTGIRIGVSTAKGLSQSTGIGLIPLSTMDALSYSNTAPDGTVIACALDARRQQVYNALFEMREGKPCRLCEDRALAIEELGEELAQKGAPVLFVGDGAHLCYNALRDKLDCHIAPPNLIAATAASAALAARDAAFSCNFRPTSCHDLTPVYLRRPQAERERMERLHLEEKA